jgi:molybdate-binding protein
LVDACLLPPLHRALVLGIPIGPLRETVIKQYSKFLKPKEQIIVPLAIRTQGIITAPGNPKNIQTVNDFVRRESLPLL